MALGVRAASGAFAPAATIGGVAHLIGTRRPNGKAAV